jgi:large subunit ribosomal protein L7/L12
MAYPDDDEPQTEFTLTLYDTDGPRVSTIKVLRELTGCSLAAGKDMLEGAPTVVLRDVPEAEARRGQALFEKVGARVTVT